MKREHSMKREFVRVRSIVPLFPVGFTRAPLPPIPELHEQLSRPMIELKLENNRNLRLMGIPYDIAVEIWLALRKKESSMERRRDPRLSIPELLCEIIKVEYVTISDILPDLGVYVADVYLRVEGRDGEEIISFKMIPSHAILIAVLSDADIYVAKKLLHQEEEDEVEEATEEDIIYW